jgi:hypothetical protein
MWSCRARRGSEYPVALPDAVELCDVGELAESANRMVEQFRRAYSPLLPGVEIHHIRRRSAGG